MKKTSTLLAIGSALFLSNAAQAEIEGEVHVGYNTDYVFRGNDNGHDAMEYGFDLSGSYDCGIDWSVGYWQIKPDSIDNDETDLYAEVSKDVGFGTLALGYTYYDYDSGTADEHELYLSGSTSFGGVDATLTYFYGFAGGIDEQQILQGDLAYGFEINEKLSGEFGLQYGQLLDNAAGGDGTFYKSATLSLTYALTEQFAATGYVSYTEGDSRFTNGFDDGHAGVSVAYSF